MAKFKPRKTGKHAKGHGKPKQKRTYPNPPTPTTKSPMKLQMEKALEFKPKTDLQRWVKFGMILEAAGYNIWGDDD